MCNYDRIELVINYACNLQCNNCDALVHQAPSKNKLTLDDIKLFIKESIDNNKKWEYVRILGGEPTLHKQIFEILDTLLTYKKQFSPTTRIQLVSNGHGKAVQKILSEVPADIEIENSQKTSSVQPSFSPINLAPIDDPKNRQQDFSKGCWISSLCGIGLDQHGYYPCSNAAAFDRVFGFDSGEKKFPSKAGVLEKKFEQFCQYCGHFNDIINSYAKKDILTKEDVSELETIKNKNIETTLAVYNITDNPLSASWEKKLSAYKSKKPTLSKYNQNQRRHEN